MQQQLCGEPPAHLPAGPWLRATILLWAAPLSTLTAGDLDPDASELAYLSEVPTVLSATRLSQARDEAPASVTVIDRHMIEASGARQLPDVLRLVPGMQTGYSDANSAVVTYHGLSEEFSRRLQVLVDGRSVYIPSFGGVPWLDLPLALEDIERIEVIRGPNSATYGSNAFLGVISITTRHSAEDAGHYVKANRGNDDIGDAVYRFGGSAGNVNYRLTARYQQDEGFDRTEDEAGQLWENNDWYRARVFTGRADYQASNTDHWEFQAGLTNNDSGNGTLLTDSDENPPISQRSGSNFQLVKWERNLPSAHGFSLQFSRDENDLDSQGTSIDNSTLAPARILAHFDGDMQTQRYDLEFQHRYEPEAELRWVWGASARLDRGKATGWFNTGNWRHNDVQRVFGNLEWHASDRLLFNIGSSWEHNDLTGSELAPRIAANYRVKPGHTTRLSWSRSTRSPSFIEAISNGHIPLILDVPGLGEIPFPDDWPAFVASGDLDPETISAAELGYLGNFADGRIQLDLKLFYEEVEDLIAPFYRPAQVTVPGVGPAPVRTNDWHNNDWARTQGIETQLDLQPRRGTRLRLGYTYMDIDSSDRDDHYSESAPEHTVVFFGSQRLPENWLVSAAYHYSASMAWLEWHERDSVSRLDIRIAKAFSLPGYTADLALVTQNLGGEYVEFRRGNEFNRRVFAQLTLAPK